MDHRTVLSRCDHLEGAFLVRLLPPWFANIRKRLVKRPRLFWRDSGLLHALMNVADLIGAARRVLVCRIARKIEDDRLLVINPHGWINRLMARD